MRIVSEVVDEILSDPELGRRLDDLDAGDFEREFLRLYGDAWERDRE
jgi:hypothetical protein